MPFFLEKILLPIIIALVVLLMGTNPWKLDKVQRVSGAIALIAAAVFASRTISFAVDKEPKMATNESSSRVPVEPNVQINSHGQRGGIIAQTVVQGDQINAAQQYVHIDNFFSGSAKAESSDETIDSREFMLLLKPTATIILGECPGEDCMQFKLSGRKETSGTIVQTIFLSGEGLGLIPTIGPYQGAKLKGTFKIKGAAMVATTDGKVGVDFPLRADTEFNVVTAKYVVTIRLTEVSIENLKLRFSYRFAKENDHDRAGDVGFDAVFSEFHVTKGVPPPSFILDTAVIILNSNEANPLEQKKSAAVHILSHFVRLLNDGTDDQFSDFMLGQRWTAESTQKAMGNWKRIRADFGRMVSFGEGMFDFRPDPPPHNARIVQTVSWDSGRTTENEYFFTIESNFIGLSHYRIKDSDERPANGTPIAR